MGRAKRRELSAAAAFLALWIAVPTKLAAEPARSAAPRSIEYVTVDANEGTSAGGHAAIRFAERTYHFQNADGGYLRIFREDSERFLQHYALLENRSIHLSRVEVSDDTYTRLRERFDQLHRLQARQFDLLEAAREDRELLDALLRRKRQANSGDSRSRGSLRLAGVGFFLPDRPGIPRESGTDGARSPSESSATLVALRERVAAAHGGGHLAARIEEVRDSLLRLAPGQVDFAAEDLGDRLHPVATYPFARRYADRMIGLLALEVLRTATPLRPETFWAPGDEEFRLVGDEPRRLRAYAGSLEADLVALTASARPDWGWPLLVGMARLIAVEATLETGGWVFLDAFPAGARVVEAERLRDRRDVARAMLARARDDLRRARATLIAAEVTDERRYAAVEAAANRTREWRLGVLEDRDVRVEPGPLVPAKPAIRSDLVDPALSEEDLERALAEATARERALTARLRRLYGYNLFTKNCVSEIFRNIGIAFETTGSAGRPAPGSGGEIQAESSRRLGGYVPFEGSLTFIPFVSARAVNDAYRVSERIEIPSYRKARLAEMYERESRIAVYLRESNTLTSTLYERSPGDSFFLLFTDDAVLPRPIYGAINLVAGLGESALGLLRLPLDGGRTLRSGLRGMFVSLPELVFFNIRKGTNEYVPPEAHP
jgi:hypothetical protein